MKHKELTEKIIGAAYTVYNILGWGFLEKVYENALAIELQKMGIKVTQQSPIKLLYKGDVVGDYTDDLLVEDKVIVELKAVKNMNEIHEVQVVNYLAATGIEVGLLLNFGENLKIKRKIFDKRKKEYPYKSVS